jgi:membrane-bound lytic murein transglycosylase D
VSNLKAWNNLRSSTIYPGQKLTVYASPDGYSTSQQSAPVQRDGEKSFHKVKSGENLGLIAKKYHCSTTDLRNWNNLKNSTIYPNQKLIVYKPVENEQVQTEVVKTGSGEVKYRYHTVKSGDTLWEIAKQYDGVTVKQLKALNKLNNSNKIKPGQKLRLAVVG